jgi:hypothetical protein
MVRGKLAAIALTLLVSSDAIPALPEADGQVHLGVASCASSVCHGKVSPDESSPVLLNEASTWRREDDHSRAYRTLRSQQSQDIAQKLGLPSAVGADICLDCHADNIESEFRGAKFQISDGVGCEACHGGSQEWIKSHAESGTSHADNLMKGMYPTESPLARAELCLSCHLGTRDKFATHQIMGAGHPRLAFELETFTANQPAHYIVDDDYAVRKPFIDSAHMWLVGLAISARESARLLQSPLFQTPGLIPELSFFQCHDCHHPTDELRWAPEGQPPLPPGAVRLNDGPLMVLIDALQVLSPSAATELDKDLWSLHQASQQSRADVNAAAGRLESRLDSVSAMLADLAIDESTLSELRRSIVSRAGSGSYRHFTAAEQAFMAVETLSIVLRDDDKLGTVLDAWFDALGEDENDFIPQVFAARAGQLGAAL